MRRQKFNGDHVAEMRRLASLPEFIYDSGKRDGKPKYVAIAKAFEKKTGITVSYFTILGYVDPEVVKCREEKKQHHLEYENSQEFKDSYDENDKRTWPRKKLLEYIEKAKKQAMDLFENSKNYHKEDDCSCRSRCPGQGLIVGRVASFVGVNNDSVEGWYREWKRENEGKE
jgi:hypothetical protein